MDLHFESPSTINYSGGEAPATGWPLGLETLNLRTSIMDATREAGPNQLILATPSFSSLSSSDFDTESSISFFPDKSITLGSLIGIRSDRPARHASNSVHPEGQTQMAQMGIVARRPKSYGRVRRWKSFIGCMQLSSRVDNNVPSLGHLLKAEKQTSASVIDAYGEEKVFINIMYEEPAGVFSGPNPLFLDGHISTSSRINSTRLAALDLARIDESPPGVGNVNDLKDWSPSGALQVTRRHNRIQSQSSCMLFVSNILVKMSPSRAVQQKKRSIICDLTTRG